MSLHPRFTSVSVVPGAHLTMAGVMDITAIMEDPNTGGLATGITVGIIKPAKQATC